MIDLVYVALGFLMCGFVTSVLGTRWFGVVAAHVIAIVCVMLFALTLILRVAL